MSSSEELDRMNRNSSLVNTMDGVSVTSSGRKSKAKFNDLLETNTELLHDDNSSSDSPSENDSFTCSEYDYEAPFEGGNKGLDHSQAGPAATGAAAGMTVIQLRERPGTACRTWRGDTSDHAASLRELRWRERVAMLE